MEKEYIFRVGLLAMMDKKILIARSEGKDTWYIPGGKIEHGESEIDALVRETQEELNCELVNISKYRDFQAHAHGKPDNVMLKMACYTAEISGQAKASSEIAEIKYANYSDRDMMPEMGKLVFNALHDEGLLE